MLDEAVRWGLECGPGDCGRPALLGIQPWFPRDLGRGGSAEIEFVAEVMLERDSEGLPSGRSIAPSKQPWDDAFTQIRGVPAVLWEDVARIEIECDAPWWVVYSEDAEAVCIEPQSAPPDAANLDLVGEHYLEALFVFSEE